MANRTFPNSSLLRSVPVHEGDKFTWTRRNGVAEVSDFNGTLRIDDQVWNDSTDRGFWIRSHGTGVERLFTYHCERKDADGDVLGWLYVSYDDPSVTVTILND